MGTKMPPRYAARRSCVDLRAGAALDPTELRGALGAAFFNAAEFGAQQFDNRFKALVSDETLADDALQRPVDTSAFANQ
ncbi:MAG: hypothetical protein WCT04_24925, partial [Planctomycetota bacterium]